MIDDLIICSRHRDTQDSGTGTDRSALDPARQRAVSLLTPREREVLLLVSRGNSNRQVAASLCISEKTAKNHLSAIFAKLGASDRTQAVVLGIRGGIVSMSETREASPPTGGSGGWSASQC
jgi:Response regulator containing a CheY-like receiver domain and an HTH DNA-binding domain